MKNKEFSRDNNSGEYYELSEGAYAYVTRGWLSDEEKNDYLVKIIKNGSCKRPETVLVIIIQVFRYMNYRYSS